MTAKEADPEGRHRLDYARVVGVAGRIAPWKITAILALDASVDELEQAVAWVSAELGSEAPRHIGGEGKVGGIHEILIADQADSDA